MPPKKEMTNGTGNGTADAGNIFSELAGELKRRSLKFACAESCTGGMIASSLIAFPGASSFFAGGAVTYSDFSKSALADVPEKILRLYGAVSHETAKAMAKGIRERLCADVAVSATGVAGPDGGTEENPVGTVYIGVSCAGGEISRKLVLQVKDRAEARALFSAAAAREVLSMIKSKAGANES